MTGNNGGRGGTRNDENRSRFRRDLTSSLKSVLNPALRMASYRCARKVRRAAFMTSEGSTKGRRAVSPPTCRVTCAHVTTHADRPAASRKPEVGGQVMRVGQRARRLSQPLSDLINRKLRSRARIVNVLRTRLGGHHGEKIG